MAKYTCDLITVCRDFRPAEAQLQADSEKLLQTSDAQVRSSRRFVTRLNIKPSSDYESSGHLKGRRHGSNAKQHRDECDLCTCSFMRSPKADVATSMKQSMRLAMLHLLARYLEHAPAC